MGLAPLLHENGMWKLIWNQSKKIVLLQGSTVLWEKRKYLNVEKLHTSTVKYAYNYQVHKKKKANLHIWITSRLLDREEEEEEEERTSTHTRVTLLCNCVILSKSRTLR